MLFSFVQSLTALLGTASFRAAYYHLEHVSEAKRAVPAPSPRPFPDDAKTAGQAFRVLEKLMSNGNRASVALLHQYLSMVGTEKDLGPMRQMLARYRSHHVEGRESTATHVIKACLRANQADEALRLIKDRSAYALKPSIHALHLLMYRYMLESQTKPEQLAKGIVKTCHFS